MFRQRLSSLIRSRVETLVAQGRLPVSSREVPVEIDTPRQAAHGDFMTNFAMVGAKKLGMNPREVANMLAEALDQSPLVFAKVEVAGPGFINLTLHAHFVASVLDEVLEQGEEVGRVAAGSGQKINVEFVSVNPNGPITIGSGRGAAYGSALCNVLEAAGHTVHREYYINDGVNSEQMRLFAESIRAAADKRALPEGGYKGDYVREVALQIHLIRTMSALGWQGQHPYTKFRSNYTRRELSDYLVAWLRFLVDGQIPYHFSEFQSTWERARAVFQQLIPKSEKKNNLNQLGLFALMIVATQDLSPDFPRSTPLEFWERSVQYFIAETEDEAATSGHSVEELGGISSRSSMSDQTIMSQQVADRLRLLDLEDLDWSTKDYRDWAETLMISEQKSALLAFGVTFDTWFSEQSLHDSGQVAKDIATIEKNGAADRDPHRTVLKMGKGGVINEVVHEAQDAVKEDSDEGPGQGDTETLWLRSTKFGDDMDRVLQRRDGRWTYIASDIAYHKDKFNRPADADKLITVLGPDHHGYIGRLRAVLAALFMAEGAVQPEPGPTELSESDALLYRSAPERDLCRAATALAAEKLQVQIFQIVRFMKDGKPAPMRKRDGNIYALIDLIDEIGQRAKPNGTQEEQREAGKDVARFFYLMRHHDTAMDFDLDLAAKQSDDNPVYYVQYAHARICSVLDKAAEAGFPAPPSRGDAEPRGVGGETPAPSPFQGEGWGEGRGAGLELLVHPAEKALAIMVGELHNELEVCAREYAVNRLTTYAVELARTYHAFYDQCRVVQPDQPELSQARVALCVAARNALRSTFRLLGISAPERMSRE